ncbi:MAG: acyltransferase [Candidatus Marinimicrobia bacterium]|nr:acyltransferase [Candidatus Neomarinimicrobiota bacterium]
MLPNSLNFLLFFAALVGAYYVLSHRWRWVLLLIGSYYFYSTFDPKYLFLLGATTLVAYIFGIAVAKPYTQAIRRLVLTAGILTELSSLFVFKYFDFLMGSLGPVLSSLNVVSDAIALPRLDIILPVGLSFYTFSCISYLVDAYRGTVKPELHLGKLAVYVAFFPKLLAGPIERAPAFLAQLSKPITVDRIAIITGIQLIVWGLFKKVVIADRLSVFVDIGFTNPAFQSPVSVLVAVYFYAFQIYCDFSGYSDIAIGGALILGIRLMENFRRPYMAKSVPEFWNKRWHLSLMRWFRDYLYIPLGGNRVSAGRRYINVMVIFLVSGLWHGANWTFVIWGGLNGLYQVVHSAIERPRKWISSHINLPGILTTLMSVLLTFHLVGVAWVFFRASSISNALAVLKRIWSSLPQLPGLLTSYNWNTEFFLSLALIIFLMVVEMLDERKPMSKRLADGPAIIRWAFYYTVGFSLLVIGMWGTQGFVYMNF